MSLIYVCTDYDLSGPSPRERARIGLLLEALYEKLMVTKDLAEEAESMSDRNVLLGDCHFIRSEIKELCKLLSDRTEDEIVTELEAKANGLLG